MTYNYRYLSIDYFNKCNKLMGCFVRQVCAIIITGYVKKCDVQIKDWSVMDLGLDNK